MKLTSVSATDGKAHCQFIYSVFELGPPDFTAFPMDYCGFTYSIASTHAHVTSIKHSREPFCLYHLVTGFLLFGCLAETLSETTKRHGSKIA